MSVTSVRIEEDLTQLLENVAYTLHRSKGWVINEALRQYLEQRDVEQQRWQETLEALEDVRRGKVVEGDKVHAWMESWGTNKKLKTPK